MMIVEWARLGTHTAAAIFAEARKKPALGRAVKRASREWWRGAVREFGAEYPAYRTGRAFSAKIGGEGYDLPAWETVVFGRAAQWDYCTQRFASLLRANGGAHVGVWLCHPAPVFDAAAREFGLQCLLCGTAERRDRFEEWHFCADCWRRESYGIRRKDPAFFALRLLDREIKRQTRQEAAA